MIAAKFSKKTFQFKRPSGTSRGILTEKHAWFIEVWETEAPEIIGVGECSVIKGLSPDFESFEKYEEQLYTLCSHIELNLDLWPSIKFGLESALLDLKNGGKGIIYDNAFTRGDLKIPINGLIWMGSSEFMHKQVEDKLNAGFSTIKMKIGALNFDSEIELLKSIRKRYSKDKITLRVDANGAFTPSEALEKLSILSDLDIHSIEQPIKAGQWSEMATLCSKTKLPIALDEELIGVHLYTEKVRLLKQIAPQFIVLKPSLHGGISGTQEWVEIAESLNIPWWITSALESNVGLTAICQLTAQHNTHLPQGLGTGSLYTNNTPSRLVVNRGFISLS